MKVLISGASVAGPALAFWLSRAGWEVTVVERAPKLREGGYAVDFRGEAHLSVIRRMGIEDAIRAKATGGSAMRFVDQRGRTRLYLPVEFAGGDLEIRRTDLARILYDWSRDRVRYVFGDSVHSLKEVANQVEVTFESGGQTNYDFVFGADGIHSRIRGLAFPGVNFERTLGYYLASWDASGLVCPPNEIVSCNVPGRLIGMQNTSQEKGTTGVWTIFASPDLALKRGDLRSQKAAIGGALGRVGWRTDELLATLWEVDDLYFNNISRAVVPQWSLGRVALVGDAAGGASIGGMGTGAAIVGAYVLAGELIKSPNDHAAAFQRYQALVEPFAAEGAANGARSGQFLAPRTRLGLAARNRFFSISWIKNWMIAEAQKTGAAIDLPDYRFA